MTSKKLTNTVIDDKNVDDVSPFMVTKFKN